MEKYFHDMLYLTACSIQNKKAVLSSEMNFDRIIMESYGQSVLYWVISAILNSENPSLCPKLEAYRNTLTKAVGAKAYLRTGARSVFKALESKNLAPIIIKGETLACLYPQPLLRMSADTDIFFKNKEQCKAAYELLAENAEIPYTDSSKHYVVKFVNTGIIELHFDLLDDNLSFIGIEKDIFDNSPLITKTIDDGFSCTTLNETDALKYIFCHLLDHFVYARCDVRQVCDVAMFIKANKPWIDKKDVYEFMEKIHKCEFFDTLQGAAIEYLGFSREELFADSYSKELAEKFILDCLNGGTTGVWGKSKKPRGTSAAENSIKKMSVKTLAGRALRATFPKKDLLFEQFPYCKKNKLLIPVAWCGNIYEVFTGAIQAKRNIARRKNLLKQLKVIVKEK